LQRNKDIFGFYTFFSNENKADWIKVFNDLIDRGLKRVMLIVSDDFPGIT
jgi:transposase-like protein